MLIVTTLSVLDVGVGVGFVGVGVPYPPPPPQLEATRAPIAAIANTRLLFIDSLQGINRLHDRNIVAVPVNQ
jgi:hypothetical protein